VLLQSEPANKGLRGSLIKQWKCSRINYLQCMTTKEETYIITQAESEEKIAVYFAKLTDERLLAMVDELDGLAEMLPTPILDEAVAECFNGKTIFLLQVQHLIYPMLRASEGRFRSLRDRNTNKTGHL
jgi:hypothetical protein